MIKSKKQLFNVIDELKFSIRYKAIIKDAIEDFILSTIIPVTDDGWISINERLPPFDEPVLVCTEGNDVTLNICRLDTVHETKSGKSLTWLEGYTTYETFYGSPTHWKPLNKAIKNGTE